MKKIEIITQKEDIVETTRQIPPEEFNRFNERMYEFQLKEGRPSRYHLKKEVYVK